MAVNPYEADPVKIPADDLYRREPGYGRYLPRPDDFVPDPARLTSAAYWRDVLARCDESCRIYDNPFGGRDVFALGRVIIKSVHLQAGPPEGGWRDYTLADANEVAATALARPVLAALGVRVPQIYFAGEIDGHAVLVQERIPGVGLTVAYPYLEKEAKQSFKEQTRALLRAMRTIQPPPATAEASPAPSYVVPDPDPVLHRGIQPLERDLLFGPATTADTDVSLMHNDVSQSNTIVDQGRIVGLVDWEMAGFFGWTRARAVHEQIRSPQRENYARLNLSESKLADMLFWNDLYAEEG